MNIKRPLAPAFLKKLDAFLLLNKPLIWSARAHLVVFYSLLFMAALSAVYLAIPDDPRSRSQVHVWIGFVSIICIIALVAWLIYLLRFNVFKRFGVAKPTTSLLEFILYFISVGVIAAFCLVPSALETARANNRFTARELADDINTVNINMCRLAYDSLAKKWKADTLIVRDTLPEEYESHRAGNSDVVTTIAETADYQVVSSYQLIDTAELADMAERGDSLNRINDSTYVVHNCPNYIFLHNYYFDNYAQVNTYTSVDLFNRVIKAYVPVDRDKTRKALMVIADKYYYEQNEQHYYNEYEQKSFIERLKERYKLSMVERSIDNIVERKFRWADDGKIFWRLWFYTSLGLTLLVFAFRHTTPRVFFLSLLSGVIITILTSLSMAFTRSTDTAFFVWLLFYFLVFAFISATTLRTKRRSVIRGISIIIFNLILPFVPLICTALYYEWLRHKYAAAEATFVDYHTVGLHLHIAEVAGVAMFLVLLVAYIHNLYRKWWGIPVE